MLRNKRGQSTLEYVLLVTAVIVIVIGFLLGNGSKFQTTMGNSLEQTVNGVNHMSAKFDGAFTTSPP